MNPAKCLTQAQKLSQRMLRIALALVLGFSLAVVPKTSLGIAKQGHLHSQLVANATDTQIDSLETARNLVDEGRRLLDNGGYESALAVFERALQIYQRSQEYNLVAMALNNIGQAYYRLDRYEEAVSYYNQALALFEESRNIADDNGVKVIALSNLGNAYEALQNPELARKAYLEAAQVAQNMNDYGTAARNYSYTSRIYYETGDIQSAQYYFSKSEEFLSLLSDSTTQGVVLANLAYVLAQNNQPEAALEYFERAYEKLKSGGNELLASNVIFNIVLTRFELGQLTSQQAIKDYLDEILPAYEARDDQAGIAAIYQNISSISSRIGDLEQALGYAELAKSTWESLGRLDKLAETNSIIANLYRKQGKFQESLSFINQAILAIEKLRVSFADLNTRSRYFSASQRYYEERIITLKEWSDSLPQSDSLKFEIALRTYDTVLLTQTRSFNDILSTSDNSALSLLNSPDEVQDKVERLQQELDQLESEINALILEGENYDQSNEEELKQKYVDTDFELNLLLDEIRGQDPIRYQSGNTRYAQPLRYTDLGDVYLDEEDDDIFLTYYVGEKIALLLVHRNIIVRQDDGSYLTGSKVWAVEIAHPQEIQAAAKEFIDYVKRRRNPEDVRAAGICLRQKILPQGVMTSQTREPVWYLSPVQGKRLVIIADGILRHVPFGALPLFDTSESNETLTQDACSDAGFSLSASKSYVPLIEQHEIVNLPSMPALYFSRQQQRQQASKALALLADPVFSDQDYRLTEQEEPQCPNASSATRSLNATLESTLSPELEVAVRSSGNLLKLLPCTRSEAEAILQKVDEPSQNNIALGFAATQSWVTNSSLYDYRILHFATHAIANEDSPEFSGLVLSRYTPQKQRISNIADDLLNLNEISRLRLNAELVVLSGCETALGQNLRGEGILGLTRGFMAAGAKRIISSLWMVGDSSTALLMDKFYTHYINEKSPPSAALRQAQLDMWKDGKKIDQWAAFTFQGEWEPNL